MQKILHLQASPRGEDSTSLQVAREFLNSLTEPDPSVTVEARDLFGGDVPPFRAPEAAVKYHVLGGGDLDSDAARAWKDVLEVIEQLKAADLLLISSPMWNFGIPYALKQYFDVVVQPGLTFAYSPDEGYSGLLTTRTAVLILSRGGTYEPDTETGPLDMQKTYLELILGFMGISDIRAVLLEPTVQAGPEVAEEKRQAARVQARCLGADLRP